MGCVCHDLAHSACFNFIPRPPHFFPGLHLESAICRILTGPSGIQSTPVWAPTSLRGTPAARLSWPRSTRRCAPCKSSCSARATTSSPSWGPACRPPLRRCFSRVSRFCPKRGQPRRKRASLWRRWRRKPARGTLRRGARRAGQGGVTTRPAPFVEPAVDPFRQFPCGGETCDMFHGLVIRLYFNVVSHPTRHPRWGFTLEQQTEDFVDKRLVHKIIFSMRRDVKDSRCAPIKLSLKCASKLW